MPKREYHFAVITKATFVHEQGAPTSTVKHTDLRLEVSGNLDKTQYLDGKGLPRKDSTKPILGTLVLGLVAAMRNAAQKGWMSEAELMHWVTDHLQEGFVTSGKAGESTMEY
jgi:hypothetical protein